RDRAQLHEPGRCAQGLRRRAALGRARGDPGAIDRVGRRRRDGAFQAGVRGRARGRRARRECVPYGGDRDRRAQALLGERRHCDQARGLGGTDVSDTSFLETLENVIGERLAAGSDGSYTARLSAQGTIKVAQKVGEEAVELALAAAVQDRGRVTAEAADLVYHLLLLLRLRELRLSDVVAELESRHRP